MSPELQKAFAGWLGNYSNRDKQSQFADTIRTILPDEADGQPLLQHIQRSSDMLPPISNWLIGGDGWAEDCAGGACWGVAGNGAAPCGVDIACS